MFTGSKDPVSRSSLAAGVVCMALTLGWSTDVVAAPLTWSLAYGQEITSGGRSLRGLALSSDEQNLYGGFIQGSSSAGVRHFTLAGDPPLATAQAFYNVTTSQNGASSTDHQPKALATDSRGFVYIGSSKVSTSGDNARIIIQDSTLSLSAGAQKIIALSDIASPGSVTGERVGGLAIRDQGGVLYLYASREHQDSAFVERYVVGGDSVASATLTLDTSFNGTGRFDLQSVFADASDLRGLEVADDGTIFVTSNGANALFRISADLGTVTRQTVTNAYDVALFDGRAFVTSYNAADSAIFEFLATQSLDILGSFDALSLFPRNNVAGTGYSSIEIDSSGRIYLADQFYFCTNATCGSSGTWGDRVLVSSAIALMGGVPCPFPRRWDWLSSHSACAESLRRGGNFNGFRGKGQGSSGGLPSTPTKSQLTTSHRS